MCTISQGPPSLNLNLDILDTVVAWSDRSTLLALMLSCRYLNSEASKRLLQHPDLEDYIQIDGKGDQGVMSFVSFMHGTGGDRYCYLRAVTLGGVEISHTVAEKLVDVLRRAKNLKFFSFRDADSSLSLHRDTVPVLNSLRSIEVLKICLAGEHTHRLLENANWPLLSVELHGPYISARELGKRDNTNPMDPFVLLRAARSTLIQLTCINWIEYGEPFRTLPVYVFPRLIKLNVVQFRSPSAAPWVEPFPNVREFTTQTFKWYSLRRGDYAPPDLTWEHDRNATKNARLRDRFWPALDVYNGRTLTDLYLLALPCPIRRVSLATMPNRWTRIFEDAMRHTQVKELKIGHLSPEDLAGDLCACFECAADSLVELHWLCLCLERQEKDTETLDIFTVLHDVASGLQSLGALETLILQIDTNLLTNDCLRSLSRFLQGNDNDSASEDDPSYEDALHVEPDISETEYRKIEEQLVTLCDVSFVTLPTLSVMYVQAGDRMYGMHRGGEVSKMEYADWPDT